VAGVAVAGFGVAVAALATVLKAMSLSFDWAKDFVKDSRESIGHARQKRISLAEEEMRHATGTAIFGAGFEQLSSQIIRRLTDKKLTNKQSEMFSRWGITPKSIKQTEGKQGRTMDALDYVQRFAQGRESLEKKLEAAKEKGDKKSIARYQSQLDQMYKDTTRGFGSKFADTVFQYSSGHIKNLQDMFKRVGEKMGASTNLKQREANINAFDLQWQRMGAIWSNFKAQVSDRALPAISSAMQELGDKLEVLGAPIADLMGTVVTKGWEAIKTALGMTGTGDELKKQVEDLNTTLGQLDVTKLASGLSVFFSSLTSLPGDINAAADAVRGFSGALNDMVRKYGTFFGIQANDAPADGAFPAVPMPASPYSGAAVNQSIRRTWAEGMQFFDRMDETFGFRGARFDERWQGDPATEAGRRWGVTPPPAGQIGSGTGVSSFADQIKAAGDNLKSGGEAGAKALSGLDWEGFGSRIGGAAAAKISGAQVNVNVPGAVSGGGTSKGGDNASVFTKGAPAFQ
jgi:hypothetical protein